jgi:hypothetical protein
MPTVLTNLAQDWNSNSKYGSCFRLVCDTSGNDVKGIHEFFNDLRRVKILPQVTYKPVWGRLLG